MEWLNLHTSILDSAEFVGAAPVERSTWLCLQRYCIGQENAGRIAGADSWGDRKWQQLARVTLREVKMDSDLWRWEGADLIVAFYPIEKQKEIEAKREAGRSTVAKRWGKQDSSTDSSDDSSINSSAKGSADTEGEGKGKGRRTRRGKRKEDAEAIALLNLPFEDVLFRGAWKQWVEYRLELGKPLTMKGAEAQLKFLAGLGVERAQACIEYTMRQEWQGLREENRGGLPRSGDFVAGSGGSGKNPSGGGSPENTGTWVSPDFTGFGGQAPQPEEGDA